VLLKYVGINELGVIEMTKTSKISSVSSSRIHNNYVHRSRAVNLTSAVESVDPVPKVSNETAYSSGNYLMSSDAFYESLRNMREKYRKFYYDHRRLEEVIESLDVDEKLVQHIQELINVYNKAIVSLCSFDDVIGTKNSNNIKDTMDTYKEDLKELGISIKENLEMVLDEYVLIKCLEDTKEITKTFELVKGLSLKLYKDFKNIKLPNTSLFNHSYHEQQDSYISGLILDELS